MTVEQQQELLAFLGYYDLRRKNGTIAIDGIPGPSMRTAVMEFQNEAKIFVTGKVDGVTELELRKAVHNGSPVKKPVFVAPTAPVDKAVHDFLISKGFSEAGTAGIMGNINAESAMRPDNMEDQYQNKLGYNDKTYTEAVDSGAYTNFEHDAVGYGLCQWTWHTRKRGLLNAAKAAGKSIADVGVQMEYLLHEMETQYPTMTKQLRSRGISVYEATMIFMRQFENPADKSGQAVQRRANLSQQYYKKFS